MSEAMRLEVSGLRDLAGRFARDADEGLQRRQDQMLRRIADEARDRLSSAAPRGPGPGPHLADLFAVGGLQRDGAAATIAVSNEKTVTSKAGQTYSLLRLITTGTRPHAIPNAFGWGPDFGTDPHFHPGTAPNPFVSRTVLALDPQAALMTTARGVVADMAGGGA